MENRIKRLEAVIVASGLNAQLNMESPSEKNDSPSPDTVNVTDRLSTLVIDDEGSSSFLGTYQKYLSRKEVLTIHRCQARHLDSLFSLPKDFNGSRKKLEVLNYHIL